MDFSPVKPKRLEQRKRSRTDTEKENQSTKTSSLHEIKNYFKLGEVSKSRKSDSSSSPSTFLQQKLNGLSLVESKQETKKFSTSLNAIPKIAVFNSTKFEEEEEEEEEDLFDKLRRKWSSEDKLPETDEEESSVKHRLSVVDASSSSTNDEDDEEERMGERTGERFPLRRNRSLSFGRNREKKRPGKIGALPIPNLRLESVSTDSSPESPCDGLISPGVFASPRPNEIFGSSEYSLQLPKEDGGSIQDCNCISSKTMSDLLNGNIKLKNNYEIIDCRFPFEFEGGHLKGSKNIYLADTLEEIFFKTPKDSVLIFHCEFSSNRGPKLYRTLRDIDRRLNADSWPKLFYPEIYLLKGGFKQFYETFKDSPQKSFESVEATYTSMLDLNYSEECKHHFKLFRKSTENLSKTKSKSFK